MVGRGGVFGGDYIHEIEPGGRRVEVEKKKMEGDTRFEEQNSRGSSEAKRKGVRSSSQKGMILKVKKKKWGGSP